MWELSLIAQNYEPRRRAIFADIDRKDGPAWAQIYSVCMEVLRSVESRVDNYGKPVAPVPPPVAPAAEKPRTLPPLKNESVFAAGKPGPPTAGDRIKKAIDRPGDSPMSKLSPLAKKTWNHAKDRMLTKEQRDAVAPENIKGQFEKVSLTLMHLSWFSALFRHEYRSEFAGAVLGQPHAEPSLYVNAATSICRLVVCSVVDDEYGNVHRDLPSIVRTLTSIIRKVEALRESFPVHWTDTNGKKDCPEVDQVLDAVRNGLGDVIGAFEKYSHDLRLTQSDIRLAKEAAKRPKAVEEKIEAEEPAVPPPPKEVKERRVRQGRPEMEQVKYR
jgi:nucleoporin NDC1